MLSQAVPSSQEAIPSGITRPNSTSRLARGSTKAVRSPSLRMDKTQTSRSVVAAAAAAAATSTVMEQSLGMMKAAVRLLSDTMDFTDVVAIFKIVYLICSLLVTCQLQIQDYLSTTNTNFTVIGIIGPQGSGKSTLLSMIAGDTLNK
ncbi:unnamed protein product [Brugia pahangi]|uniref:GB1/RHD3-type G domain-containing protein n=1 Tax=Brugia pahangi TaxID=6280 RepID=A0A0N4TF08_BRUPA|nr:unnamed protein product [Brugia pahangi]